MIRPSESTTPPATLVPPISTPIVRLTRWSSWTGGSGRLVPHPAPGGGGIGVRYPVGGRSGVAPGGGRSGVRYPAGGRIRFVLYHRAGGGHCRLEYRHRVLRHRGESVRRGRHLRRQAGARLVQTAGGPAHRAPGALRRLVLRRPGGALPHVSGPLATAERGPDLPAHSPTHPARPRTDQPPLELADQVGTRLPGLLRHVVSSPMLSAPPLSASVASARVLRPFSAVSMIIFSALRFRMPGIGTRTSTASS